MWPNQQFLADLVTFTEEIRNGKLYFLYSEPCNWKIHDIRSWLPFETRHLTSLVLEILICLYLPHLLCLHIFISACSLLTFVFSSFMIFIRFVIKFINILVRWILKKKKDIVFSSVITLRNKYFLPLSVIVNEIANRIFS